MTRRKQRTRAHVIADLSVNHVERLALEAGFTVVRIEQDYGYDLTIFTYDSEGYAEAGAILVQLKATDNFVSYQVEDGISWTLDARDLRLWCEELMPVVLIVYDAVAKQAHWIYIQSVFADRTLLDDRLYVRCRIPETQLLDIATLSALRQEKHAVLTRLGKRES